MCWRGDPRAATAVVGGVRTGREGCEHRSATYPPVFGRIPIVTARAHREQREVRSPAVEVDPRSHRTPVEVTDIRTRRVRLGGARASDELRH